MRADTGKCLHWSAFFLDRTGSHDLWLVWRKGYGGLQKTCTKLHDSLLLLRPGGVDVLQPQTADYEHEGLVRYPAARQG